MATQAPAEPDLAAGAATTPAVRLTGIRRAYGDVVAIAGLDLDIAEGEFFTLLGPSSSGLMGGTGVLRRGATAAAVTK